MGLIHRPSSEIEKNKLLGLFHLQSTPRKAEIVKWGYDLSTSSGKRDCCATGMLATLLVLCAVTISGLTDAMQLIYLKADLCKTRDSTLGSNLNRMRDITNYYEAREATTTTVNLTATAYYDAREAYNSLETRFAWPSPYDLSEEERQDLELQAREGGEDCEEVKDCVDGVIGWIGGVVGEKTCVSADVPCPDIESTALLVEYDSSQRSLDLFGRNASDRQEQYNSSVAQTALDKATDAISVLVRRINFASSIYVLYLAFLVVVTPPFVVYGTKWNHRIFDFLANVNKPLWIALIVLVWYAHELFQYVINSSLYNAIWSNFLEDPCWADPDFLLNTSLVIRETCTDITSANNLFNQAAANYRYYDQVESTWQAAVSDQAGPFYGDPGGKCAHGIDEVITHTLVLDEELIEDFPGNCTASALLNAIQPGDGNVNWWSLFFHSGALVALLLQLVLAHWFISWFSVLRPLTMHRGRVMIPDTAQYDPILYREVNSFARRRAILPFAFTTILLIFLLVNLGASSSVEGMGRNVLIASLLLAFFQFVVVPLLIWRKEDEEMPRTMRGKTDDLSDSTSFPSHRYPAEDDSSGVYSPEDGMGPDGYPPSRESSITNNSNFIDSTHIDDGSQIGGNHIDNSEIDNSRYDSKNRASSFSSSDSGQSLASVLKSARAATRKAAAVGEARDPRW